MFTSKPTLETTLNHRSIRKFTAQPIAPELLDTLIQAGQMASSSNFLQNVSIIRVTDLAKRAQIRTICMGGGKGGHAYVEACAELLIFCADVSRHLQLAPEAQIDWIEVLLMGAVDVGIFAQNVLLTAESLGLGGVFLGSIRNDMSQVTQILALPRGVVPIVGMSLGYPDQEPMQRPRLPARMIVSENAFQAANTDDLNAYNQTVADYYRERSQLDLDWAKQISGALCREVRPNVLAFLQQQGFAKR
ncbi:oxygen-insensitive NADPH nitroreductase [Kingella negevensis]|uniref:NADPH-flavin oxidoreductase n=1 Tax=Kingella negevensis TaxID=1522312 RepID=A0A238HF56_9NEIS|nr:oxygen-insensitive NADPH nitroreductase [Kingella negevensis]SNB63617.1 NADPH-flavin oxidoreductase [Kingella negevensis]